MRYAQVAYLNMAIVIEKRNKKMETIQLNLLTRKGKYTDRQETYIHTTYFQSEGVPPYPGIPKGKMLKNYKALAFKPSIAVATSQDVEQADLVVFFDKKKKPIAIYGNFAGPQFSMDTTWFWNLKTHNVVSTNPYSHSMYYMLMAYLFATNDKKFTKIWFNLDFSLKNDKNHATIYLENNQKETFGYIVTGLLYHCTDLFFCIEKLETKEELETEKGKFQQELSTEEELSAANYWNWVNQDSVLNNERWQSDLQMEVKVENPKIPVFESKQKKNFADSKDFWKQDFSMMSDEEAENLPAFLKLERESCRNLFEENKESLTKRQRRLVQQIYKGDVKNISFSGPAGSGKTTVAKIIAGALHLPLRLVTGKAGVDTSVYLGYESIQSENGVSVTKWHDGPITEAVRYGALLLFDEVNLTSPEVIGTLNTLLDDSRALVLDNGEVVKADPRFTYIEAMNRGSGYCGTEETNLSHDNRMLQVRFGEMKIEKEVEILVKNTGYDNREIVTKLCRIERYCKQNIQDTSSQLISIRDIERWIKDCRYTNDWVESGIDTVITSLVAKDEEFDEIDSETIAEVGGLAKLVYDQMEIELGGEEY